MKKNIEKFINTPIDDYDQMNYDLTNGQEKGSTTYIDIYDNCWKWKPGTFNIISGYQNEGKGQWLRFICLIKALEENKKFVFYSPEDYPSSAIWLDLIHTLSGCSTDKDNYNFISPKQYDEAYELIKDKFYFVYIKPPNNTLSEIMKSFREILEKDKDCFGFIIDPHIKVMRDEDVAGLRDDLYGAYVTSTLCDFSRTNNVITFLVMHQNNPEKDARGCYVEPDTYRIKQGSSYSDTADSVHIVWRNNYAKDKLDTHVIIGTKKVKVQKLVGIPQLFPLNFNRKTNRYTNLDGTDLYNFSKHFNRHEKI